MRLASAGRQLRQAIAIAVDYEEFIAIFLNGRGLVAQGPIPPGVVWLSRWRARRQSADPSLAGAAKARRRSLADAQALLAKAGYPQGRDAASGETLKLHYDTVTSWRR